MTTGERIKAARKKAGMTQKQLAEKLDFSYVNISQLENNQRTPGVDTLERIAAALGVTLNDLFEPTEDKLKNAAEDMAYLRTSLALDKLNLEGKAKAVERIEELLEIPRYRRQERPTASPPAPGDTDTPAAGTPTEGSSEGE